MATDDHPMLSPDSAEERFLNYVRSGDKRVLQTLIQEHADRSYNQACRIMGHAQDAEDVVQESLLLLVKTAKRYDGSVPFVAWLGRLVTSTALNHRRRIKRQKRFSREQESADMNDHAIPSVSADRPEFEAVREALDSLPERYRIPLTLHYVSGLSQAETARTLGVPSVTIRQQLARGLERLRAKLGCAGFAITSAGLLTIFANLPTYAAPPAFKAGLAAVASERLAAAARHVSQRFLSAKKFSSSATGSGIFKAAVVGVFAVAATVTWSRYPDTVRPMVAAPVQDAPGLIGHWTFDEGAGATAVDSSGYGQNGRFFGDIHRTSSGKIGGALALDGMNDYVDVLDHPALRLQEFTLSAWVQWKGGDGFIVEKAFRTTKPGPWASYRIYITLNGKVNFSVQDSADSGGYPIWITTTPIAVNAWTLVTATFKKNNFNETDGMVCVNGLPVATTFEAHAYSSDFSIEYSAMSLNIGRGQNSLNPKIQIPSGYFNGLIDDVRIYNRVLTTAEIAALARHAQE